MGRIWKLTFETLNKDVLGFFGEALSQSVFSSLSGPSYIIIDPGPI